MGGEGRRKYKSPLILIIDHVFVGLFQCYLPLKSALELIYY